MPKVGRNDPCPCGSGKKYKNCCMIREHAQQSQSVTGRRDYEELLDHLFRFSEGPSFQADIRSALSLFWNGNYELNAAQALATSHILRFFDWYAFDYPTWETKERIVEIFRKAVGSQLSASKQEMLAAWADANMSLYRVEGIKAGRYILLKDLWQGTDHQAEDLILSRLAAPGDLVVSRLLRCPDAWRLSVTPTLLPPSLETGIMAFLNRAWQDYQEAYYQPNKAEFLRSSSYLFNHYLLREAKAVKEYQPTAPKYYDISSAIETLERARAEAEQKRLQKQRPLEEMQKEEREPEPQTIAGGRLVLPSDRPKLQPQPEETYKSVAGGKILLP